MLSFENNQVVDNQTQLTQQTTAKGSNGSNGLISQLTSKKSKNNAMGGNRGMAFAKFWIRFATHQGLGEMAETYVLHWFRFNGFIARHTAQRKHQGDVTITDTSTGEIIRIELKAARPSTDGNWHFCMRKKGKTSAYHSDFVVMLAVDDYHKIYRYIVPIGLFNKTSHVKLSSHPTRYKGKFAPFLVRDDAIDLNDILTTYELTGE